MSLSFRFDTEWVPSFQFGDTGGGIAGADIPANSALLAHYDGPADAAKEFRWFITGYPSQGTFTPYEDGSWSFSGAPNGTYFVAYDLYVDYVNLGSNTLTITVGGANLAGQGGASVGGTGNLETHAGLTGVGGAAPGGTGAATAHPGLAGVGGAQAGGAGAFAGSIPGDAPGRVIIVGASVIAGAATGAAVAPGMTANVDVSLIAGTASAGDALAPGVTCVATVTLIAGAATGEIGSLNTSVITFTTNDELRARYD